MIEQSYIARPLIGAVIGYITNDMVIRMLFRPRPKKHLFGMQISFTPRLIPKEKARITASIGQTISKNLINTEVLERTLPSQEMLCKIKDGMDSFVCLQKANDETFAQYLLHYLSAENIADVRANVSDNLSAQIHSGLTTMDLCPKIAHIVVDHVMKRSRKDYSGYSVPISSSLYSLARRVAWFSNGLCKFTLLIINRPSAA